MPQCPVCQATMARAFSATVLRKYDVAYHYCSRCGFLHTEPPHWLDEAYHSAIAVGDTGLVMRNLAIATKLAALVYFGLDPAAAYLDLAGGCGLLTRLMRDFGFDFYWSDKYCENLLAQGFEAERSGRPFRALTAFEVLEHVHDPLAFVSDAMTRFGCRTLLFSTELYQGTPPAKDWWYYAFDGGQHVAFYQTGTLQWMADRLGLSFHSAHGIHMLTDQPTSPRWFSWSTSRLAHPMSWYVRCRMPSLTMSDHQMLMTSAPRSR